MLQFDNQIWHVYNRQDFIGRVAKVYLAPPLSPTQRVSSPIPPTLLARLRQPRLSLRSLAAYQNLGLLGAAYLVMYLWFGTGLVGFGFLAGCAVLLYGVLSAALSGSQL